MLPPARSLKLLPFCRRLLSEALASLQLVAVNAASNVSASLSMLQSQLDDWQISQRQEAGAIIELLGQQQDQAQQQHQRLLDALAELLEHLGTGIPQAQEEISSMLQLPDLTPEQKQVCAPC